MGLSLRSRLLLTTLIPILAAIAVALVVDYRLRVSTARHDLEEQTRSLVLALDRDVSNLVYSPRRELALDINQRLKAFPDLERLFVFDASGDVLLAYQRPKWEGAAPLKFPRDLSAHISDGHLLLGMAVGDFATVLAQSNMRSIQAARASSARVSLALAFLLILVGGITVIGLQRAVTRRLLVLEKVAKKVVRTHDYSIRAADDEKDELGNIASAINSLLSTVETNLGILKERESRLVSESKQRALAQDEVRMIERQLQESQKLDSLGRLAGGVAHDFNNLLTVILGQSELILEEHPDSGAGLILDASQRAGELIGQLLSFSKKAAVELRRVDLADILKELERLLARVIPANVIIDINFSPGLWPVEGDPGRLQQVLLNLAINARDSMTGGGKLLIAAQNMAAGDDSKKQDLVQIRVSDNGHGMDTHTLDRALEPFFTTKGEGGSGLGLAVAYGIIQQFGGTLTLESALGQGTVVEIRIPRSTSVQEAEKPQPVLTAGSRALGTILLVEDENLVRVTTERALSGAGHRVLSASDGQAALAQWEANHADIDLLVTDTMMPKITGIELARRLRQDREKMPILLISGYTGDESLNEFKDDQNFVFLAKPFRTAALLDSVDQLLRTRSTEEGKGLAASDQDEVPGSIPENVYRIR